MANNNNVVQQAFSYHIKLPNHSFSNTQQNSRFPAGIRLKPLLIALISILPFTNTASHAAGSFEGLGDLASGGFHSQALGVNADGSVVVGLSESANGTEAFRWTSATGMVGLGDLAGGSFSSLASDVNADGSVVVGYSTGANGTEAFRWTQADGMVGLGDLAGGGFYSQALGVNADGSVVVGHSTGANGTEAFRWTQADGMVGLGDLAGGGFYSAAYGVNADGSVVVGLSESANGTEAFRWTQADGMVGLGDLAGGGFYSQALGVNADGSVVVGYSTGASGNEAFRWTSATGMISVADWLATGGVSTAGFSTLIIATGVSADGNTVIGTGQSVNGTEAFIARVVPDAAGGGGNVGGSGIVGLTDLGNSMAQTHAVSSQMERLTSLTLNGAHHRTLSDMALKNGQNCGWVSGDLGRVWRQANGTIGSAEVGACHQLSNDVLVGLGVGSNFSDLDLANNGKSRIDGQYGLAEINWWIPNTPLLASLLGTYGQWDANLTRGYAIAGTVRSKGETDITGYSLRARLDWQDAFTLGQVRFSPRIAYTVFRTEVDGYREVGGTAPANFQDQNHTGTELRLGLTGKYPFSERVTLLGHAEVAHRFDDNAATIEGNINALGVGIGFRQQGNDVRKNWVRLGAEVDYRINASNVLNASTFVASSGQDADVTGAVSWKILF
jgi:probable HAF family extracellular repeat protein